MRLDQLYVRNQNFLSDLDLIFYTLIILLPGLRKNSIPTESLYNGLLARFTQRYFSWFIIDSLVAFGAVALAGLLLHMNDPIDLRVGVSFLVAATLALAFSFVNSVLGIGRVWWRYARPTYVFELALSSGVTTLLLTMLNFFWPAEPFLPRGMLPVVGLLAFLGFVSVRYRERLLTGLAARWLALRTTQDGTGERVLIVGAGECGLLASWLVHKSNLSSAFSITGLVDDDPTKEGMTIDGHRVFGLTRRIPAIVAEKHIGVILFAIEHIEPAEQERILGLCNQTQARVVLIPDLLTVLRERLMPPSTRALQEVVSTAQISQYLSN
jgi:FlaA1/EpsC-like NDP-sugar epimerase